jgi:hypothetical protein
LDRQDVVRNQADEPRQELDVRAEASRLSGDKATQPIPTKCRNREAVSVFRCLNRELHCRRNIPWKRRTLWSQPGLLTDYVSFEPGGLPG